MFMFFPMATGNYESSSLIHRCYAMIHRLKTYIYVGFPFASRLTVFQFGSGNDIGLLKHIPADIFNKRNFRNSLIFLRLFPQYR